MIKYIYKWLNIAQYLEIHKSKSMTDPTYLKVWNLYTVILQRSCYWLMEKCTNFCWLNLHHSHLEFTLFGIFILFFSIITLLLLSVVILLLSVRNILKAWGREWGLIGAPKLIRLDKEQLTEEDRNKLQNVRILFTIWKDSDPLSNTLGGSPESCPPHHKSGCLVLTHLLTTKLSQFYSFDLFCLLSAGFRPRISILLERFIDLQTLLVLFLFLYLTNQQKALLKGFCCLSVPLLNVWCHLGIWLVKKYVWYYYPYLN